MSTSEKIIERHKVLAFFGIPVASENTHNYYRMRKFTQLSHSKNPVEYSRQYVDEPFQQTDVVGFAPQYDYAFDKHSTVPVQQDIISITNNELLGDEAVRPIILVDTTDAAVDESDPNKATAYAYKRDYSVIPSTEGDNINIYTYSGSLKARGEKEYIKVSTADNWRTVTIVTD